jgi:hypothetical protein
MLRDERGVTAAFSRAASLVCPERPLATDVTDLSYER